MLLKCYIQVRGKATNADDDGVPGWWLIEVETSADINLDHLSVEQETAIAKAVLDAFHAHQGIEELDDFEITVHLENGKAISEEAETPDPAFGVVAHDCEKLNAGETPEALRALVSAEPKQWANFYLCPCGEEWVDRWDCCCNDRCPNCNKEIEPYISDDGSLSDEEIEAARQRAST